VTLDGFNLVALWVSLLSHSHSLVEHGIPFRWELAAELFSPWREKERERERERIREEGKLSFKLQAWATKIGKQIIFWGKIIAFL